MKQRFRLGRAIAFFLMILVLAACSQFTERTKDLTQANNNNESELQTLATIDLVDNGSFSGSLSNWTNGSCNTNGSAYSYSSSGGQGGSGGLQLTDNCAQQTLSSADISSLAGKEYTLTCWRSNSNLYADAGLYFNGSSTVHALATGTGNTITVTATAPTSISSGLLGMWVSGTNVIDDCSLIVEGSAPPPPPPSGNIYFASVNGGSSRDGLTQSTEFTWAEIPSKIGSVIPYGSTIKLIDSFDSIVLTSAYSGQYTDDGAGNITDVGNIIYDGSGVSAGSFSNNLSQTGAVINIDGADHITVQGFTIDNHTANLISSTPIGIRVSGSDNVLLLSNTISNIRAKHATTCDVSQNGNTNACGNSHGILVAGYNGAVTNIDIVDNTLKQLALGASEALVLNGDVDGFYVADNTIYDVNNIAIDLIGFEDSGNATDQARNGSIQNNLIYNVMTKGTVNIIANQTYKNGNSYDVSAGCIYADGAKNLEILKNRAYKCDIGIEVAGEHTGTNRSKASVNVTVKNNVVYDSNYTGIKLGSESGANYDGVNGCTIENNTLYSNSTSPVYFVDNEGNQYGGVGDLFLEDKVTNCVISNNIIYGNGVDILVNAPDLHIVLSDLGLGSNNTYNNNVYHHVNSTNRLCKSVGYTSINIVTCASSPLGDMNANFSNPSSWFASLVNQNFVLTNNIGIGAVGFRQ